MSSPGGIERYGIPGTTGPAYGDFDAFLVDGEEYDTAGDGRVNVDGRPAPLTIIPTSTSNPRRPRTYAAGYSYPTRTLTVLFRDGVLYNYYDVEVATWLDFRNTFSKGVWLRENLETRGPGAGGERVTGGQSDALANAIVARARALQVKPIQRTGDPLTPERRKLSGFQNKVLRNVRQGQSSTDAIAAARAELARVRRAAADRRNNGG